MPVLSEDDKSRPKELGNVSKSDAGLVYNMPRAAIKSGPGLTGNAFGLSGRKVHPA
jgi:hypothetical protein